MDLVSVSTCCFILTMGLVTQTRATFTLSVDLIDYRNFEHREWSGSCCDFSFINCGTCDPKFKFCMREYGTEAAENLCPSDTVFYSQQKIPGSPQTYTFNWDGPIYPGSPVYNPIKFSGSKYKGSFQFYVRIDDVDSKADDLVDRVAFNIHLPPNGEWGHQIAQVGLYNNVVLTAKFKVDCDANYYGSDCNTYCAATNNNRGHYTCSSNGEKICMAGYQHPATNCITVICTSECHPDGGYCNNPNECLCRTGWTGEQCDKCVPRPGCSPDHGSCTAPGQCICDEGYGGELCDQDLDVCNHQQPCASTARCTNLGPDEYKCSCAAGSTGKNCDTDIDECSPNPCLNGGNCYNGVNRFTCDCQAGWTGDICDININECESSPCLNGANCTDLDNGYSCLCPQGFFGPQCEGNFCESSPCVNNATCVAVEGGQECICPAGYTGSTCDTEIDECYSNPCQNNGNCTDQFGGYNCTCSTGFMGSNCQLDIDFCVDAQCGPHSVCIDQREGYICHCYPGVTGEYCDVEINECNGNPCHGGATCNNYVGYYTCHCPSGLTGQHCDVNIDECTPNPCREGGTCQDKIPGYLCVCPEKFTGKNCETSLSPCERNPCPPEADCIELDDGTFICQSCPNGDCSTREPDITTDITADITTDGPTNSTTPSEPEAESVLGWDILSIVTAGSASVLLLMVTLTTALVWILLKERAKYKKAKASFPELGKLTVTQNRMYISPDQVLGEGATMSRNVAS